MEVIAPQIQYDGLLKRLTEVPLDILYEIFSHLHPKDLLHLTRTTRAFRSVLMRRSATCVWKATIANIAGLPKCPPDLNEPQYVNLAFDEHCHFCLAPNIQDIFWSCRVRCCKSCIEENFVSDFDLRKRLPFTPTDNTYKTIFPYIVYPKPRPYKPGRILFYRPMAEKYIGELGKIRKDTATVKRWSKERKEEQMRRLSHAALCESWSSPWADKRSTELNVFIILLLLFSLYILRRDHVLEQLLGVYTRSLW
ncbi:hypothetical protein BDZ94DRAFT_1246928 [Collybia nuda]|uniref:F-box domain-containing protein n=1 Tax=Collybia nuda TaxID=64659 RepID=A0A9P5YEX9_9AGAR|nr:hypothetical protein BDZ94DRAFT_1246928 [Collybia nuda]